MSILDSIEEANRLAGIKWLAFANLQEFNSFHDSGRGLDYPVNLVVPYTLQVPLTQPISGQTLELQGWILTRLREDTNDYRSITVQREYIDPLTALAVKFLMSLAISDIMDVSRPAPTARIFAEYMFLHSHLFGVSYRCSIPINARAC